MYKKQVTELHHSLNNETNKIDKLEFETKKLMENLSTLQKERDVTNVELIFIFNKYLICI